MISPYYLTMARSGWKTGPFKELGKFDWRKIFQNIKKRFFGAPNDDIGTKDKLESKV